MQNLLNYFGKFGLLLLPSLHFGIIFHFHHAFTAFPAVLLLVIVAFCDWTGSPTEEERVSSWAVKLWICGLGVVCVRNPATGDSIS